MKLEHHCYRPRPARGGCAWPTAMIAKFKAHSTFSITGWGLALAGEVVEGTIKVGMKAIIPSWPTELTISGLAPVTRLDRQPEIALVFRRPDEREYAQWRALDLENHILEIHDSSG